MTKQPSRRKPRDSGAPLQPKPHLLAKLGMVCVHLQSYCQAGGHVGDWVAARLLIQDSEVVAWLAQMAKLGHVTKPRKGSR